MIKIKINSKDYDYIFHLAATIGVEKVIKNPFNVLNNNYLSTLSVIKLPKNKKN